MDGTPAPLKRLQVAACAPGYVCSDRGDRLRLQPAPADDQLVSSIIGSDAAAAAVVERVALYDKGKAVESVAVLAGSRATLLTLWRIDDEATATFLSGFFRRLRAGSDASAALTATKRAFLSRSPSVGAPFTLYGR